jgi:hypothetical protein
VEHNIHTSAGIKLLALALGNCKKQGVDAPKTLPE